MKKNINNAERVIRVILGLFIVSLTFWGPKSFWALIGLLPILSGLTGFCGLYALLGVSTCKNKNTDKEQSGSSCCK